MFSTQKPLFNKFCFFFQQASKRAALLGSDIRARALNGEMKLELTYDQPLPCPAWAVILSEYNASIKVSICVSVNSENFFPIVVMLKLFLFLFCRLQRTEPLRMNTFHREKERERERERERARESEKDSYTLRACTACALLR